MRVKYIGGYAGESPILHREVKPGEIVEIEDSVAETLVASGQFEQLDELNNSPGGET